MRNVDRDEWMVKGVFYKHIGIYAYKAETLRQVAAMQASSLEIAESLEQLRWLENGMCIRMGITDAESVSIDVPSDIAKAETFSTMNHFE